MKKIIKNNITILIALGGVLIIAGFGMLFNKSIKQQKAMNNVIISKENEIIKLKERKKNDDIIIKNLKTENVNNKKDNVKIKSELNKLSKQFKIVSDELTKTKECLRRRGIDRNKLKRMKRMDVIFTFYTNLPEENGGYYNITSSGKRLADGMVASINELPIGSVLVSKHFGKLIVEDRMSRKVGLGRCNRGEIPVDVYIPRNRNESRGHYYRRVNNMGIIKETIIVYY